MDTHTATYAAGWLEASLGDLLPHAPRMQPTHALTYAGEWLEASRELLHNLLVGCTQAVCWSLHCCYHTQTQLARAHFEVLSRLVLRQVSCSYVRMRPHTSAYVSIRQHT